MLETIPAASSDAGDGQSEFSSVAAVVVTYENADDTTHCLTSLLDSHYPLQKIFLVDNGSLDGSIECLSARFAEVPEVEIIRNEMNLGYSAAANLGIQQATRVSDFVLLINNDALLTTTALNYLVDALLKRPEAGLAAPLIVSHVDPNIVWQGPSRFSWLKVGAVDSKRGQSMGSEIYATQCVELTTGCVLLVRHQTFEQIGPFDELFFLYGEDTDFCLRAHKAGVCILHVPLAVVSHRVDRIRPVPTSSFSAFHMARSHVLVIRKHAESLLRIYALAVHWLAHTPCVAGHAALAARSWAVLGSWVRGSLSGMREPIRSSAQQRQGKISR